MKEGKKLRQCLLVLMILLIITAMPCSKVFAAEPTISGITPDAVTNESATDVTITGTNFDPAARVSLLNGRVLLWLEFLTISRS